MAVCVYRFRYGTYKRLPKPKNDQRRRWAKKEHTIAADSFREPYTVSFKGA
jgi:hypothetical protein